MQQEKKESQEVQVYEIKKFNMIKAPFKNNQVGAPGWHSG